jgi:2-succinyl-6-hydroxy-2,4-cyclohexadiene-1-carboxylate synthase
MDPAPTIVPTGAPLHAEVIGAGPRMVLAHGFTQTGRLWNSVDQLLARHHQVVRVDMPGHAGSTEVAADLVSGAQLLGDIGGRGAYVGYSMGARFCLHLALDRPELVRSLVLISGTAGLKEASERDARRASDEVLASELDPPEPDPSATGEDVAERQTESQARVDAFLRRWLANPLFAGVPPEANGFEERRRNTGWGLASSLRLAGTGTQLPQWDRLGGLAMPVLILTGEDDEKFTALGRRMVDSIGSNARQVVVPHAGHSPHLQNPSLVAELIRAHLDGAGEPGDPNPNRPPTDDP